MKNFWIALAVVLGLVGGVFGWGVSTSNSLVALDETVNEKWSQVENVYQRRADLIPNLVNTVKGYAKHEAQVLEEVTKARAQVGQIRVNDPKSLERFEQSQGQLSQALSHLMVVAEKYPELKADQNFLNLQSQLEGTENRIAVERMRFIESARSYNSYLRSFPQSLIASMRGFAVRPYFKSESTAKTPPQVQF